ncbi:MAG: A/G-specific adenine glycosylase [Burkholderiales bacterium]|nr:A/G-specific adenine glycosylase [Burkholderiales bacterium]
MPRRFARSIVAWQRTHGRHDLPWQNTRDPYRIWVSEIMLQQTQVAAVLGYYLRFLDRFPDVHALAAADPAEVMRLWSGLGYYSRARNLHRAARLVVDECGGRFPSTAEALAVLPGVGRSTAAAIAAFAFGARAAILDGNVKRVLARHFSVEGDPGTAAVERRLWQLAEALLPADGIEAYTQGLMDLGATVCVRAQPRCGACPLADGCTAHRDGRTAELPHRRVRKALPQRTAVMLVLVSDRGVLLERRAGAGIWGGLLCLPQAEPGAAARALAEVLGGDWAGRRALPAIEHGFTHFRLTIQPLLMRVRAQADVDLSRASGRLWLDPAEAAAAGVPAPVRRLLLEEVAQRVGSVVSRRRRAT